MNPDDPSPSENMENSSNATPGTDPPDGRRRVVVEPLVLLAFFVGWLILQIWVLPKMGVRT